MRRPSLRTAVTLQFSDMRGDPPILLYERFIVFDGESLKPLAAIDISDSESQSWSAFSPDGVYFVAGNPNRLTLYRLPQ